MLVHELNLGSVHFVARSRELETLRSAFDQAIATRTTEFVTIAGLSGTGKSRLVDAFRLRYVPYKKAFYCKGKFDASRSKEPFSALKDALGELCSLLIDSAHDLEREHDDENHREEDGSHDHRITELIVKRIHKAVGDEGSVLTSVIPNLSRLIGSCSTSSEAKDVSTAHDRFKYLFCALVGAITSVKPLVLFCDDMQWIDASSLDVLGWLATDRKIKSLMLVGAYRANEVTAKHDLTKMLKKVSTKREDAITKLELTNLGLRELNAIIASILRLEPIETEPLAAVVHEKTLGNPFFALQFLKALSSRSMLTFSFAAVKWEWVDPQRIRNDTTIACNVVDLIANKIKDLRPDVQDCLKIASCLSSTVSVTLLTSILRGLGMSSPKRTMDVGRLLVVARHEGLLQRVDDGHSSTVDGEDDVRYKFVHDRIQQAAYSLIKEGRERDTLHYKIGKQILSSGEQHPGSFQGWIQFVAADQLYRGQSCISKEEDRVELVRISLMAGKKAMELAAFAPAAQYLRNGIETMNQVENSWENYHDEQLALHQGLAEVLWCTGAPLASEVAVRAVLAHAKTEAERIPASYTLAQVLGSQQKHKEAINVEVQELLALKMFPGTFKSVKGLTLLVKLKSRLKKVTMDDVLALPDCTNERAIAAMRILVLLAKHATFHGDEVLQLLAVVICVKLTLKYGIHREGVSAFAQIGTMVCFFFGDAKEGNRLGSMSMQLTARLGIHDTFTSEIFYQYVTAWYTPLTDTLEPLLETYDTGLKQGNIEMALAAFNIYLVHTFLSGLSLGPLLDDAKSHYEVVQVYGLESLLSTLGAFRQAVTNMVAQAADPLELSGSIIDEELFLSSETNPLSLNHFYLWKMNVCYYYGDLKKAEEMRLQTWRSRKSAIAFFEVSTLLYFSALIPLARARETNSPLQKRKARSAINAIRKAVTKEHKAINLTHKLLLLDAEFLALNTRRDSESIRKAYDRAINMASRAGLRQEAALGNLRAGQYFLGKDDSWATHYLTRSVELFRDWGAHALARHWEEKYAGYIDPSRRMTVASSDHLGRKRHSIVRMTRDPRQTISPSTEFQM